MKRTLAAGVLACASMAAHAQGVTFFGLIDVGLAVVDPKVGPSATRLVSGLQNTSRWGFRGSEPLGRGLSAVYWVEGGFFADTGERGQFGRLFGRHVWAGLQGPWGTVTGGRQYLFGAELAEIVSPFGVDYLDGGVGSAVSSSASPFITRADNFAMYRSPVLGGLTAVLGYSSQRDGSEVPGVGNNVTMLSGGAFYRSARFYAGVSYESFNCPDSTAVTLSVTCSANQQRDQKHWQIGGMANIGFARLHGLFVIDRDQFFGAAVTNSPDSRAWMLGVTAPIGRGELKFSWQERDDRSPANADLRIWALGYQYPLSLRTALAAVVSSADNLHDAPALAGRARVSYGAGLRHRF
jgi:general bacterial porin, GBP family